VLKVTPHGCFVSKVTWWGRQSHRNWVTHFSRDVQWTVQHVSNLDNYIPDYTCNYPSLLFSDFADLLNMSIYVYPCNLVAIDISFSPDRAEQSSHVPLPAHLHLRGQNFPTDHHNPKADVLWSLHSISCTETRLAVFSCFQILSIVIAKCCCFYRLVGPWNVSMWRITAIMVDYILFL